jgi:hypothetical protein
MMDRNEHFSAKGLRTLVLTVFLLTGIHWAMLAFGIPLLDALPEWKYKLRFTPVNLAWVAGAFACLGLAWAVMHSRMTTALKLIALVLLGTAIQYSFAFSKGQGLDGIRDRMVNAGHAEFAKASVEQPGDTLWVLQNYEEVAAKEKYGYIGSKPPGTFLFYLLFEQMSHAIFPAVNHVERLENLRTFASWTWPLISYLVIIPLYFLARELTKDESSTLFVCVLYLSLPSVTLITLHTDQVIYPLMAVTTALLGILAYRRSHFLLAVLCGASLYVAVYFSFGLAVLGVFLLLPVLIWFFDGMNISLSRLAGYAAAIFLGGILLHALAVVFLNYDIATHYANAWANHLAWKGWEDNLETFIVFGLINLIEFSVWIGLPLTLLFLAGLHDSTQRLLTRRPAASVFLNLILAGIFIFLLIFGKTKAETARLWLFLIPFICISAASFISQWNGSGREKTILMIATLLLEMGTTYFIVHYQDFS